MKTDIKKLVKILEEFDEASIDEAYEIINSGEEAFLPISEKERHEEKVDGSIILNFEDMPAIERIIGENNLLPAHFLESGVIKQKSVARLRYSQYVATGFLISPDILLTNNHVFGSKNDALGAKIQFNYQKLPDGSDATIDEYIADPDDLFYTNASLDFSIVRVKDKCFNIPWPASGSYSPPEQVYFNEYIPERNILEPGVIDPTHLFQRIPPVGWTKPPVRKICVSAGGKWGYIRLEANPQYSFGQLVNIIQHPAGRRKEVSLQKNEVVSIDANTLLYKTDTQRGSSGSPVFNNDWKLVALHHAGGEKDPDGTWLNNEGIRIDKIVTDLRNEFGSTEQGRKILAELQI